MKKYILIGLVMAGVLSSCGKSVDSVKQTNTTESIVASTEAGSTAQETEPSESVPEKQVEPYICALFEEDKIKFYNAVNGESIQTYEDKDGYSISNVARQQDGFVALMQNFGEQTGDVSEIMIQHGNLEMKIVVFDLEGKVIKEDDMKDIPEEDKLDINDIDTDGMQIIWAGAEDLCSYNWDTKEFKHILKFNEAVPSVIKVLDNGKYVFYGCVMNEDDKLSYGFIDGDKIISNTLDYYHATRITTCGDYATITDGIDPMVGQNTSGKVILLDSEKEEARLVDVDTFESEKSIVLEDGKYIMSFLQTDTGYRVRQYDAVSMKVVNQTELKMNGEFMGLYASEDQKGCYVAIRNDKLEYSFEYMQCVEE